MKSAPCALASHSATSPLSSTVRFQSSIQNRVLQQPSPELSGASPSLRYPPPSSPASWAFCPSPNLASHTFLRLPRHLPLAAALPPHPASGSRNTCQGRGHVAAPGDQLPNTPPGKKVELHRHKRCKDRAAARPLLLNGAVGVGHTGNDAGT